MQCHIKYRKKLFHKTLCEKHRSLALCQRSIIKMFITVDLISSKTSSAISINIKQVLELRAPFPGRQ